MAQARGKPAALSAGCSAILRPKQPRANDAEPIQPVLADDAEGQQTVTEAAKEIDAARFVEVSDRHRNVAEPITQPHGLNEELRVKHEIVRVSLEWNSLQHFAPV